MTRYEEILSKVSPIFYKFLNYRIYFSDNWKSIYLYLQKIKLRYYLPTDVIIIKTPSYFLHIIRRELFIYKELRTYPTIHFFKSYLKGKFFETAYDEVIVSLILNNFSIYKEDYSKLFIALVGKDTYDTIRSNIK